jgi:hypothetical protein
MVRYPNMATSQEMNRPVYVRAILPHQNELLERVDVGTVYQTTYSWSIELMATGRVELLSDKEVRAINNKASKAAKPTDQTDLVAD